MSNEMNRPKLENGPRNCVFLSYDFCLIPIRLWVNNKIPATESGNHLVCGVTAFASIRIMCGQICNPSTITSHRILAKVKKNYANEERCATRKRTYKLEASSKQVGAVQSNQKGYHERKINKIHWSVHLIGKTEQVRKTRWDMEKCT